jgi:uncharacterized membrane protein
LEEEHSYRTRLYFNKIANNTSSSVQLLFLVRIVAGVLSLVSLSITSSLNTMIFSILRFCGGGVDEGVDIGVESFDVGVLVIKGMNSILLNSDMIGLFNEMKIFKISTINFILSKKRML